MISKNISHLTAPENILAYNDQEKITAFAHDRRNATILVGTKTGKLRIHHGSHFSMQRYSERQINRN